MKAICIFALFAALSVRTAQAQETPEASLAVDASVLEASPVINDGIGSRQEGIAQLVVAESFNTGELKRDGLTLVSDVRLSHTTDHLLQVHLEDDAGLAGFVEFAQTLPSVAYAGIGTISTAATNDPAYDLQQYSGMSLVDVKGYWALEGRGLPSVVVGIIDTGIAPIQELSGRIEQGWNFLNPGPDTSDNNGHGTKVASIIAASVDNGIGIAGVAPNVHVVSLKACDAPFGYTPSCQPAAVTQAISEAFQRAADGRLQVLNMSLGTTAFNSYEHNLFCEMLNTLEVPSIAASGNTGGNVLFPASSSCVVAVGGIRPDGTRNPASNYGSELDTVAPYATYAVNPSGQTELVFGTSFSAPVVAGIAALQSSGSFVEFRWMELLTYHQSNWNSQTGNGTPNWALYNLWDTACSVYDFNGDGDFDLSDIQTISSRYGAFFGSRLYDKKFDLDPRDHDLDIDIGDLSKVFGRAYFTCSP